MIPIFSTVQLQGTFRRALVQLVQVGFFQAGLFLLGFAVVPLVQTALPPKGSPCAPRRSEYTKLAEYCLMTLIPLMGSMASAMVPIQMIPEDKALNAQGRSVRTVRFLRGAAFVALTLSVLTMCFGLTVTFQLLVVKTARASCWSAAKKALVGVFLAGAGGVFLVNYVATYRVIFSSEVEEADAPPA
jgi:hypothetical protein